MVRNFRIGLRNNGPILLGKRINPQQVPWLMGPFGEIGSIADDFVNQLAKAEGLIIERNARSKGLIPSMHKLKLSETESARLSPAVIDFYQNTSNYNLKFAVKWNPVFKFFGILVKYLFSSRINQLNIPISNPENSKEITSEIINLSDAESNKVKYTIWYRTFKTTGQVLYSGVYSTCSLPSGEVGVKAVFPLPKGNATVIMLPEVGPDGELRLVSSGNKFGDAGFYFLLHNSKGDFWSHYIRSFRDELVVRGDNGKILAEQVLTLWGMRVVRFNYEIRAKE